MSHRIRKLRMLAHFISPSCPSCGRAKTPQHWLCLDCAAKIEGSFEQKQLDEACKAHVAAAEAMIQKAFRANDPELSL